MYRLAPGSAEPQEERGYESTQIPPVNYPHERKRFDEWTLVGRPMSTKYIMEMRSKYGIPASGVCLCSMS